MIFRGGFRVISISDTVVETINRYSSMPENTTEAGGILIGHYRNPHIEVLRCSEPMARDRRTRTMFDRCDEGHQHLALTSWRNSARTETFVGEWHTHPELTPTPSSLDIQTWKRVTRTNVAGSTLFLIKGYTDWWAGLGTGKMLLPLTLVQQ